MADTHEEQLLTRLLDEIAREDAHIDAAYLESRVLADAAVPARARSMARAVRYWSVFGIAAAATIVIAVSLRQEPDAPDPVPAGKIATEASIERPVAPAPPRTETPPRSLPRPHTPPAPAAASAAPEPLPFRNSDTAEPSAIEFVPLMPMMGQEFAGSFQIVRVQLPSASLGPLMPPLRPPGEIVEADVLLGEDGVARAIRLSTNGSVYPWRSR